MVFSSLNQTRVGLKPGYDVVWAGHPGLRVTCDKIDLPERHSLRDAERTLWSLNRSVQDGFKYATEFGRVRHTWYWRVLDDAGNDMGYIHKTLRGFWRILVSYEIELSGQLFTAYEVGLGKEGIKIPLYQNDRQIALIEKDAVVADLKDSYSLCALSDAAMMVALLFSVYYDRVRFPNRGEAAYKSKTVTHFTTFNKEINAKYDPKFKQRT